MYHTLREIAKDTGVSKPAVFQHYRQYKQVLSNHTRTNKNRILLDDKGYFILINSFKHLHSNVKRNANSKSILTVIKLLKAELKDKDTRITKLDKQNDNLNELLKHQQELQLGEQRKNKVLTQTLSKSLIYHEHKQGFWYRLKHLFK